jgi:hypothetical protein
LVDWNLLSNNSENQGSTKELNNGTKSNSEPELNQKDHDQK